MADLQEAARTLVEQPPCPPKTLASLRNRIAARHRRRRMRLAIFAALVIVGAGAGMLTAQISHQSNNPVVVVGPAVRPLTTLPARPIVKPGHVRVNFGNASIVAPKTWTVGGPGSSFCDPFQVIALGKLGPPPSCPAVGPDVATSSVHLAAWSKSDRATALPPDAPSVLINGHRAIQLRDGSTELSLPGPDPTPTAGSYVEVGS